MKGVESSLKRFERVNKIFLDFRVDDLLRGFHEGNDLLTPTMKLKRKKLQKYYANVIDKMYQSF